MSPRRPHHSARSTFALILSLAAILVAIAALVSAHFRGSAKVSRDVSLQRARVVLLPTLADEPSAQAIMGPLVPEAAENPGATPHPEPGTPQAGTPWYGLCAPGSVASLDDFRQVVHSNPRLAVYYGGFNWAQARLVTTTTARLVYVSYQKAGTLARTRRPMLLPKGDTLLTDGVRQARTYCCNEVFELVDAPPPPPAEGYQSASLLPSTPPVLGPPASPLSSAPPASETPPAARNTPPVGSPVGPPVEPLVRPPAGPLVHTPVGPPVRPPAGPLVHTPVGPPVYPPVGLPVEPPVQPPAGPLVCPSMGPPARRATAAVPEVPTGIMLGLGLVSLAWCRWRAWRCARRGLLAIR